jgi:hypothetical protein
MVYALLSLVRRGVKRPQIWACVVEAIIKLLASESNIGQRDRQLLFNKFFTRQVSVGNRLVWKCTRNLKYCRLFDYLLAEICNAALRITKWININLVFIFQIPKHIYSLLSFSCRVKISIGDNRTLNSCRLFWADRRKFSRRVKEISRVWRRSKIVPDNRLAHVESRIQCRSVSKVGPCNPYSLMYTIIVRSIIWIQRSKHYIWSIHLSKGLFGYRVCSLCLCYLLSANTPRGGELRQGKAGVREDLRLQRAIGRATAKTHLFQPQKARICPTCQPWWIRQFSRIVRNPLNHSLTRCCFYHRPL